MHHYHEPLAYAVRPLPQDSSLFHLIHGLVSDTFTPSRLLGFQRVPALDNMPLIWLMGKHNRIVPPPPLHFS